MSMPVGYSGGSLLPGGETSVPIMAMRGGGGGAELTGGASMIQLPQSATTVPIQAMSGGGQVGGDGSDAVAVAKCVGITPSTPSSGSEASIVAECAGIKKPSDNPELRALEACIPGITGMASTPVEEGLPITIFGNKYRIRPSVTASDPPDSDKRTEDSELTNDEQAVIKLWRADEYYTPKEKNKFLDALLYGCRVDNRIQTDPKCEIIRDLLTHIASKEWGAFHSSGDVVGMEQFDRERCKFVFKVDVNCDMKTAVIEEDFMKFFTEPVEIIKKPIYTYLDKEPSDTLPADTEYCNLTLQDVNTALRMAAISGMVTKGIREVEKKRIVAQRNRLLKFISTICNRTKDAQKKMNDYLFTDGGSAPPIFQDVVNPGRIAEIKGKISLLLQANGDIIRERVNNILQDAINSQNATGVSIANELHNKLSNIDTFIVVLSKFKNFAEGANEPVNATKKEGLSTIIGTLIQFDNTDSKIFKAVLSDDKARTMWYHIMPISTSMYSALHKAYEVISPPDATIEEGQLVENAIKLINLMRARKEFIEKGQLDKDGNPIVEWKGSDDICSAIKGVSTSGEDEGEGEGEGDNDEGEGEGEGDNDEVEGDGEGEGVVGGEGDICDTIDAYEAINAAAAVARAEAARAEAARAEAARAAAAINEATVTAAPGGAPAAPGGAPGAPAPGAAAPAAPAPAAPAPGAAAPAPGAAAPAPAPAPAPGAAAPAPAPAPAAEADAPAAEADAPAAVGGTGAGGGGGGGVRDAVNLNKEIETLIKALKDFKNTPENIDTIKKIISSIDKYNRRKFNISNHPYFENKLTRIKNILEKQTLGQLNTVLIRTLFKGGSRKKSKSKVKRSSRNTRKLRKRK